MLVFYDTEEAADYQTMSDTVQRPAQGKPSAFAAPGELATAPLYTVLSIILITLTALYVYSDTFSYPFQFDDVKNILNNPRLTEPGSFWPPLGTRFVAFLTFYLNYQLHGPTTAGFHIVNTFIHIANGLLVWVLVRIILETPAISVFDKIKQHKNTLALAAALIFTSHPVNTQAVTYISQRFTSLAALFYLSAIVLYIKARLETIRRADSRGRTTGFYILSIVSTVLAMKTKEIAFTLPLILVLCEAAFFGVGDLRKQAKRLAPFILALAIIPIEILGPELGIFDSEATFGRELRDYQIRDLTTYSPFVYAITELRVIVTYLRLLVLPINQSLDYDYPAFETLFTPEVLLSLGFIVCIAGAAVWLVLYSRRRGEPFLFLAGAGVLWFFITLGVESSIVPIRDVIFEHRLYLPGVGTAIAASATIVFASVLAEKRLRINAGALALALALTASGVLAYAAHERNRVWRDEITLWEDVTVKHPAKARGHNNLGLAYYDEGRKDEALDEFNTALGLSPDFADAYNNIGLLYYETGRVDDAFKALNAAIRLKPDFAAAYNNMGIILDELDWTDEAIREYNRSITFNPDNPNSRYNLGNAYMKKDRFYEAAGAYSEAVRLMPSFTDARLNLAEAYQKMGLDYEANLEFEKVLALDPENTSARKGLEESERPEKMRKKIK